MRGSLSVAPDLNLLYTQRSTGVLLCRSRDSVLSILGVRHFRVVFVDVKPRLVGLT